MSVFADFCKMSACALAAGSRESEYLEVAKGYDADDLNEISRALALLIDEMEANPFRDLLGPYYLNIAAHSSKQARGEFFTPPEICRLMVRMLFDVESVKQIGKPISVSEPACGSGGMVLALAELFAPDGVDLLRVTCQDINPVATDMCYINTTLWGIPAWIVRGDTIAMTVLGEWKNIHWHRVGEDRRQLFRRAVDIIACPEKDDPTVNLGQFRKVAESKTGQFFFDF